MCGGDGLYHLIGTLTAAPASQPADVTHAIKMMYAQGDIDTETFHRLMTMEEGGYLSREDLLRMRETVQRSANLAAGPGMPQVDAANNQPLDTPLQEIEIQLSRLLAQAEDAELAARRPGLTDEEIRAYLEIKQGALFRAQTIRSHLEESRTSDHKQLAADELVY